MRLRQLGFLNLFGKKTFAHGVHPPQHKLDTARLPIRRMAFAEVLHIPLDQHIGKPAIPLVRKGHEVVRGEPIAAADGFLSVPIHAPATGVIERIELMPSARGPKSLGIVLRPYASASQEVLYESPLDVAALSRDEFVQAVQETGMVGLGGAAFPSHVKFNVPKDAVIDTFIANGCECEPFLTTDHRVMLEQADALIKGTLMGMRAVNAKRAIIGIEDNKPDAAAAINARLPAGSPISVELVETKYPQGAEKMLITSLLGREVPSGGHSFNVGVVVNNVGTLAALGRLLPRGQGLIERVVTVAGPGVKKPGNYLIPIGTPLSFILEQVGIEGQAEEIILGGPMMGSAISSLDVAITKGTSGVLVFNEPAIAAETRRSYACIKCGACVEACPIHLNPSLLGQLGAKREYASMAEKYHLNDCFECGCCTYVCPSNIPLVQYFRIAKAVNRERVAAA